MILVTGASGFIGKHLCSYLVNKGHKVRAVVRQDMLPNVENIFIPDLAIDWTSILEGIEIVYHLASRVHLLKENVSDPLAAFRQVNVQGTENLVKASLRQGVKRFIYVSSIHVNGETTPIDGPFTEQSPPQPQSPYAVSKWEAEQAIDGLEKVIVRPPLVYGAGVKANFKRLTNLAGLPLPFSRINNKRSLIGVTNLVDFLHLCGTHPDAGEQTFLISDGEDLSTPDLIRRIAHHRSISPQLFPFPPDALKKIAGVTKQEKLIRGLLESLVVDSSKARTRLGWSPPLSVDEELARCFPHHPQEVKN